MSAHPPIYDDPGGRRAPIFDYNRTGEPRDNPERHWAWRTAGGKPAPTYWGGNPPPTHNGQPLEEPDQ